MATRTFGWVQNPNRLETLRDIVSIFASASAFHRKLVYKKLPIILRNNLMKKELYDDFIAELSKPEIVISYDKLKGKGAGGASRSKALCTGIVQASIDAQKKRMYFNETGDLVEMHKPYSDDWTSEGYLRWAISTGLVLYDNTSDSCSISNLGKSLVQTVPGSYEEREVFAKALLSYPPVCRVLDVLSDQQPHTKFEIGSKLGFKGEMGFTSIPQAAFVYDYCMEPDPELRQKIRSNTEGDSDKYARTIANWLTQMEWVESCNKSVCETYLGQTNELSLQAWRITRKGEKAIAKSKGYSKNPQIEKIVCFEMLATKVPNAEYVRLRRAHILNGLKTYKSIEDIQRYLSRQGLDEEVETIKDDIENFPNIGIFISQLSGKYKIADKLIGLEIPVTTAGIVKADITRLKDHIRTKLHNVNHDYLVLVDLAYSDASTRAKKNNDAKDFEIQTAKLLTEELEFHGERLGNADRPDVIIYKNNFGTIIDNKSYANGFSVDRHCADEMFRYVKQNSERFPGVPSNEWWKNFDESVTDFSFLFVTSFLKGKFEDNLEEISQLTHTNGAAIGVDNLLYLAESLKSKQIPYSTFFNLFQNKEITIV